MRTARLLALLVLPALCLPASRANGQQPAALELTVTDASSGEPIRGARVTLSGGVTVSSNGSGVVLIRGLLPGPVRGEVTHMGYRRRAFAIPLAQGSTLSLFVPLEPAPIALSPVEVEAEAEASPHGVRSQRLKDFYERVRQGAGHYLTRDQIDAFKPRQISDLYRMIPGLKLVPTAVGDRAAMSSRDGPYTDTFGRRRECPIQYFVDGTPYEAAGPEALYMDLRPDELEGIEVYTGTVGLPPQFRRSNRNCGVILIWKRERM